MFDGDKEWRERSSGVVHKLNISPAVFRDVLTYIYTGKTCAGNAGRLLEFIAAAEEMELDELSSD